MIGWQISTLAANMAYNAGYNYPMSGIPLLRRKTMTKQSEQAMTPAPTPAHPEHRREPLPWQAPKDQQDDPRAWQRVQALMDSPSYREADRDTDFLDQDAARGLRLQLDYLKPQVLLQRIGIAHTIVAFGSTRITEPGAARRKLEDLQRRLDDEPEHATLRRQLKVAERILDKSRYYEVARRFGYLVGCCGSGPEDPRVTLITGGGPGIMEAANRGSFDAGARSIGLNIRLPHEQYPNPYITPDLCFRFRYFAMRKLHFLLRAKALVAFPGGYGTVDELFEALTLVQTRKIAPLPVVLVGESFWRRAIDFDFLADEGVIDAEDRELFWYAEQADEAWQGIQSWHRKNGTPLFDSDGAV